MEQVIAEDPWAIRWSAEALERHHRRRSAHAEADQVRELALLRLETPEVRRAHEQPPPYRLLPHGLTSEELLALSKTLEDVDGLRGAWVVQRQQQAFPYERHFVLVVATRGAVKVGSRLHALERRLASTVALPGTFWVLVDGINDKAQVREIQEQPGAEIGSAAS